MWTCPKCNESIEDQFDSCWKCAGAAQASTQKGDPASVYPAISLVVLILIALSIGMFWRSPHFGGGYFDSGGAIIGVIASAASIWAFFRCPWRHWFAKLLTLLLLVPTLFYGVITTGSFCLHLVGF